MGMHASPPTYSSCTTLCRADLHGQVSLELAEPYYLYGKALLELSRSNSSILGSGIPGELNTISQSLPH